MVNLKSVFLSLIGLFVLISCGTEPTPTYQLTTSVVGNGSVSPSSGQFDEGESVTITSTPDSGWVFSNWEGDWTSSQTPATITMDKDKNIIGVFERKEYPLNVIIGEGEGSVSERVVSQPKVTDYPFETVVELTPVPANEWWVFSSWSGDITSNQQVVEVKVNGETNITLNFGFTGTSQKTTYQYDINNNLVQMIRYYRDGRVYEISTYEFDASDNMIEYTLYRDNTIVTRYMYEYDSNNNMTKESQFDKDGSVSRWKEFIYDSNNNMIEESLHTSNGIVKTTYEYDSNSNLIKETIYGTDGSIGQWTELSYDTNNNNIEQSTYEGDGTLFTQYIFKYNINNNPTELIYLTPAYRIRRILEYDVNGNKIKSTEYDYDSGGLRSIMEYEYDSNSNRISEIRFDKFGIKSYKFTREYDSQNRIIKQTHFDGSDNPQNFITFEYDSNNNLIEEVRYEYQKGKIVSNQTDTAPLNKLCNQLNSPEQQLIPIVCEE